jgi:predicted nucleotidyltransferase
VGTPRLPPDLERSLRAYRSLLDAKFGARLSSIGLFGSRAQGDPDEDSDADVSVVIDGLTDAERSDVIDLAFEAWQRAGTTGPLIAPCRGAKRSETPGWLPRDGLRSTSNGTALAYDG